MERRKNIMLMRQARKEIVDYGKMLFESGLTSGTAGNLSVYDPKTGYMAISPSGVPYEETKLEDIVITDLDGKAIEGTKKPSSECGLHAAIYKVKPEARAVVHTHSMACTTLASLGEPIKAVHYALASSQVAKVPVAPYATYGTPELAANVQKTIGKSDACLMANHGVVCCGASMKAAYGLMVACEWCAELQWRCECAGTPKVLSNKEMMKVVEKFKTYGQSEPGKGHGYAG
jgi:L-fuculose-phosphate aldolase